MSDRFFAVGIEFTRAQWRLLSHLSPQWMVVPSREYRTLTWRALRRRGWIEYIRWELVRVARLTREGKEIRDRVYVARARRVSRLLGERSKWAELERRYPPDDR